MTERILDPVESLKVEIMTLRTQLLNEQKKSMEYQQVIVDLRKTNLDLKGQLLEADNEKALSELGVVGDSKITMTSDGKYKVESLEATTKK